MVSLKLVLVAICFLLLIFGIGYFEGNPLTSRVTTQLVIIQPYVATCTFSLQPGWNLIGISCRPSNSSIQAFINESGLKLISIHAFDTNDTEDPWKSYNPDLPAWVEQDLNNLDRFNGYWVNSREKHIVNFTGEVVEPTMVELVAGWNLVGFPNLDKVNISDSLKTINNEYSIVYAYNSTDGDWKVYDPNQPWSTQDLQYMSHNLGFWIKMLTPGVWRVD